ncbi:MAG TPA: diacylglycerol kinase family protein [Oscillospiraceae bacterium]|nr:diacylglycerol kinase family protein [Oscillospiraceae bacterium]
MKHLFIINPVAGKGKNDGIPAHVAAVMEPRGLDFACVFTKAPGDATRIAEQEAALGGEVRIYACGGDGTLNEVICGAAGYPNAAVTHFPCGSGNDFIKIFGAGAARFFYLGELLDADEAMLDLIDCNGRLACSLCSVGFDARIGIGMADFKKLPFVSGPAAYRLSLLKNLLQGTHRPYRITLDGEDLSGEYTLIAACNGRYYGSGFYVSPRAMPDDGILEFVLVKEVSLFTIASVVGHYASGEAERYPQFITCRSGRSLRVVCDRPSMVNVDGERLDATEVCIRLSEKKFRFFYPKGATWRNTEQTEEPAAQI